MYKMRIFFELTKFAGFILASTFLIFAIFAANNPGNTWGNSIGFLGFIFLFPATILVSKLSRSQFTKISSIILGFIALLGLLFTTYSIIDAKIRWQKNYFIDGPIDFYPPEIHYQIAALIVCTFLLFKTTRTLFDNREHSLIKGRVIHQ